MNYAVGFVGVLTFFLVAPLVALFVGLRPGQISAAIDSPLFTPSVVLSLWTSAVSVVLIVATCTPVAWWLSRDRTVGRSVVELLVKLPIIVPPAVVGVALLHAFGRFGVLRPLLPFDIAAPFSSGAVILAQFVVAAPFYVLAAQTAFSRVDDDTIFVARALGATPADAFFRVAIPIAKRGLVVGASLAWARALGEFGATLIFAGNLSGTTQTMPLAVLTMFESEPQTAIALSCLMMVISVAALAGVSWVVRR